MKRLVQHVITVVAVLVVILIGLGVFVYSGIYDIGADAHHTRAVHAVLQTLRERSIHVRSESIEVPNLNDPQLILKGAGHYAAMCTGCHLRPGMESSELREGMYPQPPNLSRVRVEPREAFWVIKHGIKMSAMPAWGVNHDDPAIWSMVAFLEKLPDMTLQQYEAIVAEAPPDEDMAMDMDGGGHSHSHAGSDHDGGSVQPESGMSGMPGMNMAPAGAQPASGSSSGAAAAMHAMLKPGAAPEAEAVAQAFHEALKRGDRAKALALLAPGAQITEGGETQSRKEYAAHHLGQDIAFLKDASVALLSRASMRIGDRAHVASDSRITTISKGKPLILRSHEQMELKRIGGKWKVVSIAWTSQRVAE